MDKFTTKELTIELVEDVPAHKVARVRVNGELMIMGYHQLTFLKDYTKEEDK